MAREVTVTPRPVMITATCAICLTTCDITDSHDVPGAIRLAVRCPHCNPEVAKCSVCRRRPAEVLSDLDQPICLPCQVGDPCGA